jgi:hypothetical protein
MRKGKRGRMRDIEIENNMDEEWERERVEKRRECKR